MQADRLDAWSHALRFLWNLAHEQRLLGLAHPREERRYPTAYDQINEITGLRRQLPWLADVPRNVSACLLNDLQDAWSRWFKQKSGKPRWKKRTDSVGIRETYSKSWSIKNFCLYFPKLGPIRAACHRTLMGQPKTCALVRDVDQWFAVIVCEIDAPAPAPRPSPVVALDRGVVNATADSDGRIVESPRFLRVMARRLTRAQRTVARRVKGSRNQAKARLKVAKLHRKVRRQRDHFLHNLSAQYAKSHGVVVVEDLRIGNMTAGGRGKRGLNRSILDVGWGKLVQYLRYKLEATGGLVEAVPAAYSSQECAACGHVARESRSSQSVFCCVACGHRDHADVNAARILLKRRASRSVLPVEDSPLEGAQRNRKRPISLELSTKVL